MNRIGHLLGVLLGVLVLAGCSAETTSDVGGSAEGVTYGTLATGARCLASSDCQSGVCSASYCRAPSCSDTVRNGTEADVDCGGSCAAKCAAYKHCTAGCDCASGSCVN